MPITSPSRFTNGPPEFPNCQVKHTRNECMGTKRAYVMKAKLSAKWKKLFIMFQNIKKLKNNEDDYLLGCCTV
jgi:hypothetical protein